MEQPVDKRIHLDPNWIQEYVREYCDKERQIVEERRNQAIAEVVTIEARAATAVKLFNQYGIHDQIDQVCIRPDWAPGYTVHCFPPYELHVAIKWVERDVTARLMKKTDCVLEGTIQECVRALAALLKVPEPK